MANLTPERKQYLSDYRKEKLKRVPLDMPTEMYAEVKAAAEAKQMPVNTFIKWLLQKYLDHSK